MSVSLLAISNLSLGIAAALALLSIALVAVAGRGRMEVARGRCATCRHALHDPLPPKCPECGGDLTGRDAVAWGVSRSRRELMATGVLLGLLAALIFSIDASRMNFNPQGLIRSDPARVVVHSPTALSDLVLTTPHDDWLWRDIMHALREHTLTTEQIAAIAVSALRRLHVDLETRDLRGGWPVTVFNEIIGGGLLDDEALTQVFGHLADDLVVHAPTLVRRGDSVFLVPQALPARLNDHVPDVQMVLELRSVTHDGRPLELVDFASSRLVGWGDTRSVRPPKAVLVETPDGGPDADAAELHVDVLLRVRTAGPIMSTVAAVTVGAAPAPLDLSVELPTIVHRVEIVGTDEPLPRPVDDPEMALGARAAISVERVVVARDVDGESHVVQAVFEITPMFECGLGFDASLHFTRATAGELPIAPIELGTLSMEQRSYQAARFGMLRGWKSAPRTSTLLAWAPQLPQDVTEATILLTPRSTTWLEQFGSDRRLATPIELLAIQLQRLDLEVSVGAEGTGE